MEKEDLDDDGNEFEYSIDEVEVPEDYEKSISEDGLTVVNKYKDREEPEEPEEPEDDSETLPKTGQGDKVLYIFLGLIFIALGFILKSKYA